MARDAGGQRRLGLRKLPRDRKSRLQLARDLGALEQLALADNACGQAAALGGDFATASSLAAEVHAVREATGSRISPLAEIALAGVRGRL